MMNHNNEARIAEAVANTIEAIKTMTDAEVMTWAAQWAELALNASWDKMSQAMATVYSEELQSRLSK